MYPTLMALALAILYLDVAVLVHAGLFVFQPAAGSTCQAGQPCLISWVDDGSRPLLSAVGVSTVGLYTGKQQLVQNISPVDVTTSHSITFTPNPAAGPNSDSYYVAITSVSLKNESVPYSGWSPFFTLTGMSGSFDNPLPAATSSIPIPVSLTKTSTTASGTRTITVGVLSTAVPSPLLPTSSSSHSTTVSSPPNSASSTPLSSTSKFTTVVSSSSSTTPTPSSSSPTSSSTSTSSSSTSGSVGGASRLPSVLGVFAVALSSLLVLL